MRSLRSNIVAAVVLLAACGSLGAQGKQGIDAQSQKQIEAQAQAGGTSTAPEKADPVLHVCADPSSLPQSNDRGEGYENKIAEALAHDLGKKVEYTFFPQRMGFVRMTLRARNETTLKFKCDLIIGVTPFETPNARLASALGRAGALGVLDLGRDPVRARAALAEMSSWAKGPWGVRVPAGCLLGPHEIPAGATTIMLPFAAPWSPAQLAVHQFHNIRRHHGFRRFVSALRWCMPRTVGTPGSISFACRHKTASRPTSCPPTATQCSTPVLDTG